MMEHGFPPLRTKGVKCETVTSVASASLCSSSLIPQPLPQPSSQPPARTHSNPFSIFNPSFCLSIRFHCKINNCLSSKPQGRRRRRRGLAWNNYNTACGTLYSFVVALSLLLMDEMGICVCPFDTATQVVTNGREEPRQFIL